MCPSMKCLLRDQHEQWKHHPEKPSRRSGIILSYTTLSIVLVPVIVYIWLCYVLIKVWRSSVVNYNVLIHFILKNALSIMRVTNLLAVEVGSHHYNSFTLFVDYNPIHFCSCLEILCFGMVKRDYYFCCLDAYLPSGLCLCMLFLDIYTHDYLILSTEYWVLVLRSSEWSEKEFVTTICYYTQWDHTFIRKKKIIWCHSNIIFQPEQVTCIVVL